MLGVVEHEQRSLIAQAPRDVLERVARIVDFDAQLLRQPRQHGTGGVEVLQLDPHGASRKQRARLRQRAPSEAALADTARAQDRQQPALAAGEQGAEFSELNAPADKGGLIGRHTACHGLGRAGWLRRRQARVQPVAQAARGLYPKVLGQARGIGLVAAPRRPHLAERELSIDQRGHRLFVQRVGLQQGHRGRDAMRRLGALPQVQRRRMVPLEVPV